MVYNIEGNATFPFYHNCITGAVVQGTALVLGVSLTVSSVVIILFFLGALTSALVICLCYILRRLKAPPSQTSTSGTTIWLSLLKNWMNAPCTTSLRKTAKHVFAKHSTHFSSSIETCFHSTVCHPGMFLSQDHHFLANVNCLRARRESSELHTTSMEVHTHYWY